jgi:acylphosphatase
MKVRAHVIVSGRVQGVFFRSVTQREAEARDVKGWVRNLPKGSVEAVFEGEEEAVNAMVEFCRRGPSRARITNVDLVWEDFKGEFGSFEVRYG